MTKPTIYTVAHPEDLSPPVANQGFCVDVVLASDYAALEQEISALDAINRQLNDRLNGQAEELAAAGKMIEKLAAENEGIKQFCKDAAFDADYEAELGMERGGFTDGLSLVNTTATDAAIAEIRASGAEALTDRLQQLLDEGNFAGNEVAVMAGAIHYGRDMAQQLRAEASK